MCECINVCVSATLTGMYGCSGSGTSNGISVSVKSVLSNMSKEPSSIASLKSKNLLKKTNAMFSQPAALQWSPASKNALSAGITSVCLSREVESLANRGLS